MKPCEICEQDFARYCFDAITEDNEHTTFYVCADCGKLLIASQDEEDYWSFESLI